MKKNNPRISETKQQVAQKSMRFNRFMLFRYVTALFLFVNLYWSIISLANWTIAGLIPIFLMMMDACILVEQTQKFWRQSNRLQVTKYGFWVQAGVNLVGLVLGLIGQQQLIVAFMNQSGRWLLVAIFAIGLLICLYVQRKIWLIEHDRDKYLTYMKAFETHGGK